MDWPVNNKPANFEDLSNVIKKAIKFCYNTRRKNKGQDVPWEGPPLTLNSILAGCPQIAERLKAENLAYDEDDQGRDALDVIIGVAIQLGIEQGHRIEAEKREGWLKVLESCVIGLR